MPHRLSAIAREAPLAIILLSPMLNSFWAVVALVDLGLLVVAVDAALIVARYDRRSWRDLLAGTSVVSTSILRRKGETVEGP